MKKIILPFFCALFVLALSVSVVLAEEDDSSGGNRVLKNAGTPSAQDKTTPKNVTDRFKQLREQKIEELKQKKEDLKAKLEQKKKELQDKRFGRFLDRIEKIMTARREALNRLDLIAGKIQTRIDKLKASGADVSAMQAALTACGSVKSAAAASIADAGVSVLSIDFNAANAKDLAQAQVSAIQQSNQALKSYHACLKDVISQAPNSREKGATGSAQ
ncbi:MAG: hypothetical protein Q7S45_01140 [Candidatus Curtissbacteria bacterium]|nr:hypothetical protein [Candidatus Curtissbacteria bacterium]